MRVAAGLLIVAVHGPALAQENTWNFAFSPYLWAPGISSSVETRFGTLDADASIGDVLSATDFALMGAFEARNGRWGLIADLVHSDLTERSDTAPGRGWRPGSARCTSGMAPRIPRPCKWPTISWTSDREAQHQPAPDVLSRVRREGDVAAAVAGVKDAAVLYPLSQADRVSETSFVDVSGVQFNTISANDLSFYHELNAVVQNEPADWVDPDTVGLYAAVGIVKGEPFAPDGRMKSIRTDAVAVGNAIARSNLCASRDLRTRIYTDRQWFTPFLGGSYQFLDGAERLLDARAMFFYCATGITPAMTESKPGTGSAYAITARDATGSYFDGSRTYQVTLPGRIPAKDFWSFTVYDNQTRSLLATDQKLAGLDSTLPGIKMNPDGGATVWFGPEAPDGQEGELGADTARQGLQRRPAYLWPTGAMVQPEVAPGGRRSASELIHGAGSSIESGLA